MSHDNEDVPHVEIGHEGPFQIWAFMATAPPYSQPQLTLCRGLDVITDLLGNARKTECGTKKFLMVLAVRAAPFALCVDRAAKSTRERCAARGSEFGPCAIGSAGELKSDGSTTDCASDAPRPLDSAIRLRSPSDFRHGSIGLRVRGVAQYYVGSLIQFGPPALLIHHRRLNTMGLWNNDPNPA